MLNASVSSSSTTSSSASSSTPVDTAKNKSRSTAGVAVPRGRGVTRGRGDGKDDTNSTNSTRSIFSLSNNFNAVRTTGLFPVLAEKEERDKGGGKGSSPQDTNKTKNTKKKRRRVPEKPTGRDPCTNESMTNASPEVSPQQPAVALLSTDPALVPEYPVVSDFPEIDKVVHELYDIFTRDPETMVQIQIDKYLFAADAALVAECGGDMHTCVLHESQESPNPETPLPIPRPREPRLFF